MTESNMTKIEQVAHYAICHSEPNNLGATKLNKVLWFADVFHYRKYGKTVTGLDAYVKMPRGPVPHNIEAVLSRMKQKGLIIESSVEKFSYPMRQFYPLERIDADMFSSSEIEAIHEAIAFITPMTATLASNETQTTYWDEIEMGKPMKIGAASIQTGELEEADLEWALLVDLH
jgi:hypothetical protein